MIIVSFTKKFTSSVVWFGFGCCFFSQLSYHITSQHPSHQFNQACMQKVRKKVYLNEQRDSSARYVVYLPNNQRNQWWIVDWIPTSKNIFYTKKTNMPKQCKRSSTIRKENSKIFFCFDLILSKYIIKIFHTIR